MKNLCLFLVISSLYCLSVFAEPQQNRINNFPQGTFKKTHNGKYIQYDKNGKKIGIYKISNGRYIKVK